MTIYISQHDTIWAWCPLTLSYLFFFFNVDLWNPNNLQPLSTLFKISTKRHRHIFPQWNIEISFHRHINIFPQTGREKSFYTKTWEHLSSIRQNENKTLTTKELTNNLLHGLGYQSTYPNKYLWFLLSNKCLPLEKILKKHHSTS